MTVRDKPSSVSNSTFKGRLQEAGLALGWGTIGAFLLMITGILIIMADAHVDPLALLTEDVLHSLERVRR